MHPSRVSLARSRLLTVAVLVTASAVALSAPRRGTTDGEMLTFPAVAGALDGTGNNTANAAWGAAGTPFVRRFAADYSDGVGAPSGSDRPSARAVSNAVLDQQDDRPAASGISSFVWQWGQFLDHDIDLTLESDPAEPFPIAVPADDLLFDPDGSGDDVIPLSRSLRVSDDDGVGQQVNGITAFIDASNVYGSDAERAAALRTLDGTGRLRTGARGLLPYNDGGLVNAPSADAGYFLAGDVRCNEQVGLTALHTLFVREHNHWADVIRRANRAAVRDPRRAERRRDRARHRRDAGRPLSRGARKRGESALASVRDDRLLTGDEIYAAARTIVAAEMQAITYREFLPLLLGDRAPAVDGVYRSDVDPGITNAFATAAYRVGHTMLPEVLLRLDRRGNEADEGHLALAAAFFRPDEVAEHGIDGLLRGLAAQPAQEVDARLIGAVRNFLFGPPGAGGFDLAALNIQRGRDHGLPGYNAVRAELGRPPATTFDDIAGDQETADRLASVYGSVDDVDLWVGGLSEPQVPGALVGETFARLLTEQFVALRDGDRFWYRRALDPELVALVEAQTLARIIQRNSRVRRELPADVWHVR